LIEGYGQTECMGAAFITDLNDNKLGRVGGISSIIIYHYISLSIIFIMIGPFPCIEFKL